MSGNTRFLDKLNKEVDTLNSNHYYSKITTIAKVNVDNNSHIDNDEEEEVVIGLGREDRASTCAQVGEYGENRLTVKSTITNDKKNGKSAGTIGVADVEEAEGARVSPSLRSKGRLVSPSKINLEQLATWIKKEYGKLAEGNDED